MPIATSTAIALSAGAAAAGVGASIYGANKNAKAQRAAADANIAAQREADAATYARWLESQGVGQDGKPVNTWLPRYFTLPANAAPVPAATPAQKVPFLIKKTV